MGNNQTEYVEMGQHGFRVQYKPLQREIDFRHLNLTFIS